MNSEASEPTHTPTAYLERLNPEQRKGASHGKGPILILAGAGSGKTRVLTHRIAYLLESGGVRPDHILAVTFTNKATREMKNRLESLLGDDVRRLWVGTFHSICLRVLRRGAQHLGYTRDFVVYDSQDVRSLMKQIIRDSNIDEKRYPAAFFERIIDRAKNAGISAEEFDPDPSYAGTISSEVYLRYQQRLLAANAMDFGDLLSNCRKLFLEEKNVLAEYQRQFEYVLVDEFQDTNQVQYEIVRALAAPQNNLFVVGDDDQSIYAFRGATIENILNFEKDYPQASVIKLEQNYRSTHPILEASNAIIAKNRGRKGKTLWTAKEAGHPLEANVLQSEVEEARYIADQIMRIARTQHRLTDIAIFYRTNAQSRAIEEALVQSEIPYRIFGGLKFYDRKEIKDILAYLRFLVNPLDSQGFLRCVNTPPRGIGAKAVQRIGEVAQTTGSNLLDAAREVAQSSSAVGKFVVLMEGLQRLLKAVSLHELVSAVIDESGYRKRLEDTKDLTAQSRLENTLELQAIAAIYSNQGDSTEEDLRTFLDRVALTSSGDNAETENASSDGQPEQYVSLMTLHLAKGLEFPVVFLTGLEEGLLPHYKSLDEAGGIEEERRLLYVGMTRAMERLFLTRSVSRGMFSAGASFGSGSAFRLSSRFIEDLPEEHFSEESVDFLEGRSSKSDEGFGEFYPRSARKQKASKRRTGNGGVVTSADALHSAASHGPSLPALEPNEISPGSQVLHQTFGYGEVLSVEGEEEKLKVLVKFNNFSLPKKLLFRHAKLMNAAESTSSAV